MDYKMLNTLAYEHVLKMIQNNQLEMDKVYSETRLSAQLKISRTPVREALVRLSNERYIDILPSRGFVLHRPTREDIIEAYHVRTAIESYCVKAIAMQYATPAGGSAIAELRRLYEKQCALNQRSSQENQMEFWQTDVQFHSRIVSFLNCPAFDNMLNTFMHFFISLRLKNCISQDRNNSTLAEHEQIVRALERGNTDAARESVQRHMESTLALALENIND